MSPEYSSPAFSYETGSAAQHPARSRVCRGALKLLGLVAVMMLVVGVMACDNKKGIQEIKPSFGNIAGNDEVTLIGKGFKPGLEIRFGGRRAKGIVIESDTKIRLKTPSGPQGKVDVVVIDEAGKTTVLKKAFTYRRASKK